MRLGKGRFATHNRSTRAEAANAKENEVAEKPAEADYILKAMVAVAASDGRLDTSEVGLIQQVYKDQSGRMLTADEVARAAEANTRGELLAEFAAAAKSLDKASKEEIVRAAYLVLLADDRIAGEERKKLKDIAAALQIPEIHFGAILEDLAVWLAQQKS
jgi:tellurite resistance protein